MYAGTYIHYYVCDNVTVKRIYGIFKSTRLVFKLKFSQEYHEHNILFKKMKKKIKKGTKLNHYCLIRALHYTTVYIYILVTCRTNEHL